MRNLAGRAALVVNGGRGVGAEIALALAEAGAAVALLGRESCELTAVATMIRLQGRVVLGVTADFADPDDIAEAVETAREALGPLTILIDPLGLPAAHDAVVPDMHAAGWGRAMTIVADESPILHDAPHGIRAVALSLEPHATLLARIMEIIFT